MLTWLLLEVFESVRALFDITGETRVRSALLKKDEVRRTDRMRGEQEIWALHMSVLCMLEARFSLRARESVSPAQSVCMCQRPNPGSQPYSVWVHP